MRALLDNLARNRKIIVSLAFALALVGVVSASQGFISDSRASAAEVIRTNNTSGGESGTKGEANGDTSTKGDGKGDLGENGKGGESQSNTNSSSELCGFAWGATTEPITPKMGVGWISFNSKDCDVNGDGTVDGSDGANIACPVGPITSYGVTVDASQNLDGYAWSNTLGWLKFGG
ncbi:MAG TPA: hypothetical protein VK145_01970, partial [Candidatus Nanoarchaeia archaeon]|nr:hypothetical protein [Candidatus Nanoarchaeia archaeon]